MFAVWLDMYTTDSFSIMHCCHGVCLFVYYIVKKYIALSECNTRLGLRQSPVAVLPSSTRCKLGRKKCMQTFLIWWHFFLWQHYFCGKRQGLHFYKRWAGGGGSGGLASWQLLKFDDKNHSPARKGSWPPGSATGPSPPFVIIYVHQEGYLWLCLRHIIYWTYCIILCFKCKVTLCCVCFSHCVHFYCQW